MLLISILTLDCNLFLCAPQTSSWTVFILQFHCSSYVCLKNIHPIASNLYLVVTDVSCLIFHPNSIYTTNVQELYLSTWFVCWTSVSDTHIVLGFKISVYITLTAFGRHFYRERLSEIVWKAYPQTSTNRSGLKKLKSCCRGVNVGVKTVMNAEYKSRAFIVCLYFLSGPSVFIWFKLVSWNRAEFPVSL